MNTKIHAVCDALGNPLRLKLTPGNRSDVAELPALLGGLRAGALLADKGHDSDAAVALAESLGMQAVIPPRPSRKKPRAFDAERYRAGHLVENLFQRMKTFRRVATRDDKLDRMFMGFVLIAGIMKWIH